MVINNLSFFLYLSSFGTHFGFNTNILETNILNLAVVVGIVVSFGGNTLNTLLLNRRNTVLKNLQEGNRQAEEAREKIKEAKHRLKLAEKKASEILKQSKITAEKEEVQRFQEAEQNVQGLHKAKEDVLKLQQKEVVNDVYQHLVLLTANFVRAKLSKPLPFATQVAVTNFYLGLFSKYKG